MITDVKLWTGVTPKLTQSLGTSQFTVPCGLFGLAAEQPVYTPVKITIFWRMPDRIILQLSRYL